MELWIRSQDKKYLLKCDRLYISKNNNGIKTTYKIMIDIFTLGIYETEERALEILDEIQNVLLLKNMYLNDKECCEEGWKNRSKEDIILMRKKLAVYEMPQE